MANIRIENHSDEVKRAFENAFSTILEDIGQHIEGEAKDELENSPRHVDTSNLKNNISHQVVEDEKAVYIGTDVEYAIYVHEGTGKYASKGDGRQDPWAFVDEEGKWHMTRGIKPNRFLMNAVKRNKNQIKKIVEDGLKNG